nr:Y4yA family PLP-dependent enzyme [Cytophagales bacterium]
MPSTHPKLTPIVHSWIKDLTSDGSFLQHCIEQYGSPVNIHNLISFEQNYLRFKRMFHKYGVSNKVFFARKANKCKSFVYAAKEYGFGVDTTSLNEMKDCIAAGLDPEKITVTAAIKNMAILTYAVDNHIPVTLDNEDECQLLQQILEERDLTLAVGFRITGFVHKGEKLYSRFGFDLAKLPVFLRSNLKEAGSYDRLLFRGLHFHLSGYSIDQRISALSQSLDLAEQLLKHGLKTTYIDMGGGILMNYLKHGSEWVEFHETLKNSLLPHNDEITFRKDPLGLVKIDKQIYGEANVYPYYNEVNQDKFVEKIIIGQKEGFPIYHHLKRLQIELRIEPGRSLLEQCGITVAKVAFRKRDIEGRLFVGLEMSRMQLFSSSADFLLDPLFIPIEKKQEENPCEVYFVGTYCLEQELILKRKIQLPQFPQIGDLVCFVNTAGYMMHFYESEAHLIDLAKNLVVEKTHRWEVYEDSEYVTAENVR